jgi:hypothetical protein
MSNYDDTELMRDYVKAIYNYAYDWSKKVDAMSDDQVCAIYLHHRNKGKVSA